MYNENAYIQPTGYSEEAGVPQEIENIQGRLWVRQQKYITQRKDQIRVYDYRALHRTKLSKRFVS